MRRIAALAIALMLVAGCTSLPDSETVGSGGFNGAKRFHDDKFAVTCWVVLSEDNLHYAGISCLPDSVVVEK